MIKFIKKILHIRNNDIQNIELIRKSKYFDEKYYLLENPNIKGDPCTHYYYYGWKEGKSPSFNFSTTYYLKNNKDVADSEINPLLHYLKYGEAENRLIEKDNGYSLKKAYEEIYNCPYFYRIYIEDININRVNLFFDKIDNSIFEISSLLNIVIKFVNDQHHQLRIIYSVADFDMLKQCLEKNKIDLPKDTIFLNLKTTNYLEVGLNEKYICTSWKNARALLNSASIHDSIYFYFNSYDANKIDEYYHISSICTNPRVISLVEKEEILNKIKKCNLAIKTNSKMFQIKDSNQLYCDFGDLFVVGVELLNEIFLNNVLKSSDWRINIIDLKNKFKFHFDTNVGVRRVKEIDDNITFMFKMKFKEEEITEDYPVIQAYFKEEEYQNFKYINILKDDVMKKMLENKNNLNDLKNNDYIKLKEAIIKMEKR